MSATEIHRRAQRYNLFQVFLGLGLILASLILWFLSFCFVRFAISLPFQAFDLDGWRIGSYVAWIGVAVLILEGVRYAGPRLASWDGSGVADDDDFFTPLGDAPSSILTTNFVAAGFETASLLLSQALCAAPRMTVDGIFACLARVPTAPETASEAAQILAELRRHRRWVSAHEYDRSGAALVLLERLELIWVERKSGVAEIRYPAGKK